MLRLLVKYSHKSIRFASKYLINYHIGKVNIPLSLLDGITFFGDIFQQINFQCNLYLKIMFRHLSRISRNSCIQKYDLWRIRRKYLNTIFWWQIMTQFFILQKKCGYVGEILILIHFHLTFNQTAYCENRTRD